MVAPAVAALVPIQGPPVERQGDTPTGLAAHMIAVPAVVVGSKWMDSTVASVVGILLAHFQVKDMH